MRTVYMCICLLLVSSQSLFGQETPGLILQGKVIKITKAKAHGSAMYDLRLRLELVNASKQPIIVLLGAYSKRQWWLLNTLLASSVGDLANDRVIYASGVRPANSRSSPKWKSMRKQLERSAPPKALTHKILPGKKYIYRTYARKCGF